MTKQFIHIFAGHFGSGKTEIALNFAVHAARGGEKVTIVDLDIVNPYFRTNDAKAELEQYGIDVIASDFAGSNVDLPVVSPNVMRVFTRKAGTAVFDVGGDDDGAYALGRYRRYIHEAGYRMYFVANTMRPMTRTSDGLEEIYDAIEQASGLVFTDIINNTNLASQTDYSVLRSGLKEIEKLSKKKNVPVSIQCGIREAASEEDNMFLLDRLYMKKPWE